MRTLIYTAFVSLDGVVDSPGSPKEGHRSGGWTFQVVNKRAVRLDREVIDDAYEIKRREQQEASAMMLGRTSYCVVSLLAGD